MADMETARIFFKACGDWYFDGPGWIVMMLIGPLIVLNIGRRRRIWIPVFIVLVLLMPFTFLFRRAL